MNRILKLILFVMIMAGYSSGAIAQTFTWVAPGSGFVLSEKDWSTSTNWEVTGGADDVPGDYPNDPNDHVVFDRHRSIEKCVIDVSDAKCGNITSNLDAGSFIMDGKTMEVYGNINGIKVLSNSIRNGSVIIMKGSLDAGMSEIDIPILQVKKDSKTTKVEIGVNVIVDELIISQAYIETTGAGDIETIKNFTLDADGISGAESTININIGGANSVVLKGGTASDPSLFKVVSGTLTITNDDKIILRDVCNFEQTGGKIIAASSTTPSDAPIQFNTVDATISGDGIEIDGTVNIELQDASNTLEMPQSIKNKMYIGPDTPGKKGLFITKGKLLVNADAALNVRGDLVFAPAGKLLCSSAVSTNLIISGDWDCSSIPNGEPDPFTKTTVKSYVTFDGAQNSTLKLCKNSAFQNLSIAKSNNTYIVEPTQDPLRMFPVTVNGELNVFQGIFRLVNATDDMLTLEIQSAIANDLNRNGVNRDIIYHHLGPTNRSDLNPLKVKEKTGETIEYPAADLYVEDNVTIADKACLDLGTNEPQGNDNKTIAMYVGKKLQDSNTLRPSNASTLNATLTGVSSSDTYLNNPGPARGLYIGLSTRYPMGIRTNCSGANFVPYVRGKEPRENYQIPSVVFFGENQSDIVGTVDGLPGICNGPEGGVGLSLPNVYVIKEVSYGADYASTNYIASSVNLGTNLRINGNLIIGSGRFNLNGNEMRFGDYAGKRSDNGWTIYGSGLDPYGRKVQTAYAKDDKIQVYGIFDMGKGSTLLMNTGGEERGSILRVRKGGFFLSATTSAQPNTMTREGTPGQYYRMIVHNGGGIEAIFTTFTFMSGLNDPTVSTNAKANLLPLEKNGLNPTEELQVSRSPNYDLPGPGRTKDDEDGPGSGHGWMNSRGGLKVMMGAIVNPNGKFTNVPEATLENPHGKDIRHNFSYCKFGSGGINLASLTINTGQNLVIYGTDFNKGSGWDSKNIISNARLYEGNDSLYVNDNDIVIYASSGVIGGTLGEQFDGGRNDVDERPNYDQIRWVNNPLMYWVGGYEKAGFRQTNGEGPRGINPVASPATINENYTRGDDKTAWENPKNWSLSNNQYYNPFQIYPGQNTLPPDYMDNAKKPTYTPEDMQKFEVYIGRTAPNNPILSSEVKIQGFLKINSGIHLSGTGLRWYYSSDAWKRRLYHEDIDPIAGWDQSLSKHRTLIMENDSKMEVVGDIIIEVNGKLEMRGNAELKAGSNINAIANLEVEAQSPPATSTSPSITDAYNPRYVNAIANIDMEPNTSIVCNGIGAQELRVRRNFISNLVLDKPSGVVTVQGLSGTGERTRMSAGSLTIKGGEFRMISTTPLLINGDVTINGTTSDASFTFNDSPVCVRGSWINENGEVSPGSGRINFHPNSTTNRTIKTNGQQFNAVFFGFQDDDTNGGYFFKDRDPDLYYPAIGSSSTAPLSEVIYEVQDNFKAQGQTTIQAKRTVQTKSGENVPLNFSGVKVLDGAKLTLNPGGSIHMNVKQTVYSVNSGDMLEGDKPTKTLLVAEGGVLEALGTASKGVTITRQGVEEKYFKFLVQGKIKAEYCTFSFIDKDGVDLSGETSNLGTIAIAGSNISTSSVKRGFGIDVSSSRGCFSGCTFTSGEDVDGATYLNLPDSYIYYRDPTNNPIVRPKFLKSFTAPNTSNIKRVGRTDTRYYKQLVIEYAEGVYQGEDKDKDALDGVAGTYNPDGYVKWIDNIKRWDGRDGRGTPTADNLWSNPLNWEGDKVPDETDDVWIDFQASNIDPLYATGGRPYIVEITSATGTAKCKSLTAISMTNPGSSSPTRQNVNITLNGGDLTVGGTDASGNVGGVSIDEQVTLTVTGSETIRVTDSWSNNGTFEPGTGFVIFDKKTGDRAINTGTEVVASTYRDPAYKNPFYNLVFETGSSNMLSDFVIKNNLNIASGAILDDNENKRIEIHGNWMNSGDFIPNEGEVAFVGETNDQTLTCDNDPETFYNLTIKKNADKTVTLVDRVIVGEPGLPGKLTLINGIIISDYGQELIISDRASWTRDPGSPNNSAFVKGPVGRMFRNRDKLTYPIGDSNYSGQLTSGFALDLELKGTEYTTFTMEQVDRDPESWTPGRKRIFADQTAGQELNMTSVDRFYLVRNIEFPATATTASDLESGYLTLQFKGDQEVGNFPKTINGNPFNGSAGTNIGEISDISIVQDYDEFEDGRLGNSDIIRTAPVNDRTVLRGHNNGSIIPEGSHWKSLGGFQEPSAASLEITSGKFTTLGNGQFTFAWRFVPLPVEVLSFDATKLDSEVLLEWVVNAEFDVVEYVVERSTDGKNFKAVGSVPAKNTSELTSYKFVDTRPIAGLSYYRLRRVEKDGKPTYSKLVSVNFNGSMRQEQISLYPNPTASNIFNVRFESEVHGMATISIKDAMGHNVWTSNLEINGSEVKVDTGSKLPKGVYVLTVQINGQLYTKRLAVL